jgi:Kef-type K+ transport system membrane component KefB
MHYRIAVLLLLISSMTLLTFRAQTGVTGPLSSTLVLGFMLLSAYSLAFFFERLKLPRLTGSLAAGLLFGPHFLNYYPATAIADLGFLNSMALAFIIFYAGGELKAKGFSRKAKTILWLLAGITVMVFVGITLMVFWLSALIPFLADNDPWHRFSVACIIGTIAVSLSPAATIAIINETKAAGHFTEKILSVTIITDVIIIILFGITTSFYQALASDQGTIGVIFLMWLLIEIIISFLLGFLLGKATIFLITNVKLEFPIVLAIIGFMVIKFSHVFSDYLRTDYGLGFSLEPLLICLAAGFTVQNFSRHGHLFLSRMDRVSYPIFLAFFAIIGASINLDLITTGWFLGLVIATSRIVMLYLGVTIGSKLSGEAKENYQYSWLSFITQAGVSLGLLAEVVRRFPEIGTVIQAILIVTITANELIGPIAFKYALGKSGETGRKGYRSIGTDTGLTSATGNPDPANDNRLGS